MKFTRASPLRALGPFSFLLAFAAALPPAACAQITPSEIGTWELNLTKSTFDPGPPPKSQTRAVERVGDGVKVTSTIVRADGTRTTAVATQNYDGKDYPIKGNPSIDTVTVKRIDAHTGEVTAKKAGKVSLTNRIILSKDGHVMTITTTGTNASGQSVHNVQVYDKQ